MSVALNLLRRSQKYEDLFQRAMKLARRYRAERDEARHQVFVLENSDALEVVALESRVRMLEQALTEVSGEKERFCQESRDSARHAGRLIREIRECGCAKHEDAIALASPAAAPQDWKTVCGHGCTTWCTTTGTCPLDAAAPVVAVPTTAADTSGDEFVPEFVHLTAADINAVRLIDSGYIKNYDASAPLEDDEPAEVSGDACNCQSTDGNGPWHPRGDTPTCPTGEASGDLCVCAPIVAEGPTEHFVDDDDLAVIALAEASGGEQATCKSCGKPWLNKRHQCAELDPSAGRCCAERHQIHHRKDQP